MGFADAGRFIDEEEGENNMYTFEPVKFNSEEEAVGSKASHGWYEKRV